MADAILKCTPSWAGRKPVSPLIRISYFFSKPPTQSYEDFFEHWRNVHGRLCVSIAAFTNCEIQRYVQVRNCHGLGSQLKSLGMEQMKDFTWDACSELYVREFGNWVDFATSEESRTILGPDGANVVDFENGVRVTVGLVDEIEVRDRAKL